MEETGGSTKRKAPASPTKGSDRRASKGASKVINCEHKDRPHYGLGRCKTCYFRQYMREYYRRKSRNKKDQQGKATLRNVSGLPGITGVGMGVGVEMPTQQPVWSLPQGKALAGGMMPAGGDRGEYGAGGFVYLPMGGYMGDTMAPAKRARMGLAPPAMPGTPAQNMLMQPAQYAPPLVKAAYPGMAMDQLQMMQAGMAPNPYGYYPQGFGMPMSHPMTHPMYGVTITPEGQLVQMPVAPESWAMPRGMPMATSAVAGGVMSPADAAPAAAALSVGNGANSPLQPPGRGGTSLPPVGMPGLDLPDGGHG
ncbi:unnamed protein product [Chrysoparadoxa australica]